MLSWVPCTDAACSNVSKEMAAFESDLRLKGVKCAKYFNDLNYYEGCRTVQPDFRSVFGTYFNLFWKPLFINSIYFRIYALLTVGVFLFAFAYSDIISFKITLESFHLEQRCAKIYIFNKTYSNKYSKINWGIFHICFHIFSFAESVLIVSFFLYIIFNVWVLKHLNKWGKSSNCWCRYTISRFYKNIKYCLELNDSICIIFHPFKIR